MSDLVRQVVGALDEARLPDRLRDGAPWEFVTVRGRGHGRKAVVLVLAGGAPVLFLKTASDDGAADLARECSVLHEVASLGGVHDRAPRALDLLQLQGRHVLVLTALPGRPMLLRLRTTPAPRRSARQGLQAACSWLEAFQRDTRLPVTRALPLVDLLARYRSTALPLDGRQEATWDQLASSASRFDGLEVPVTGRHGDLWPGNIMLDGEVARVVDWEHFVPEASPLDDLWFLLISTGHALPGRWRTRVDARRAFARAFLEPGWYSSLVLDRTRRHLTALELPTQAAEVLLLAGLLDRVPAAGAPVDLAPVGPDGGDWEAHVRALLSHGGSLLRHL